MLCSIHTLILGDKNRSMVTSLIWPKMVMGVSVIFDEILEFTRVRHIVSSKRVVCRLKVPIRRIQN